MAFASLDFLAVVKPSFCSAYLRGLDRLTIQTSRRGMFVPLLFFSDARTECIVDSDPHPLELPGSQVMVDTLPLGEIGGQHTPLDPTFGDIKDGIEYGPHTQGTRSSTAFGGWDHIFDPLPFLVGQVAWIYFFVHIPILHNPRRLFRQALRPQLLTCISFLMGMKHLPSHFYTPAYIGHTSWVLIASPVKVILPLSTCYTRDLLNALSGGGHHAGQSLRAFCRKKPHLCDGARHTGTRTGRRPTEC